MREAIAILAGLVMDIVGRVDFTVNDFMSLCVTGENLIARTDPEVDGAEYPKPAISAYLEFVAKYAGELPTIQYLRECLDSVLADLRAFADLPLAKREPEDGADLLNGIDEILLIGAALVRMEKAGEADLLPLRNLVRDRIAGMVPQLITLADYADRRSSMKDGDFWEVLAVYSPERHALRGALRQHGRIERAIRK